ncbi:MAG: ATP-binding protein [Myxococcota bacterium]
MACLPQWKSRVRRRSALSLPSQLVLLASLMVLFAMATWILISRGFIWPEAIRLVERTALERLTVVVAELMTAELMTAELMVVPEKAHTPELSAHRLQAGLAQLQVTLEVTLALTPGSVRLYRLEQGVPVPWSASGVLHGPMLSDQELAGLKRAFEQGSTTFPFTRAGQAIEICVAKLHPAQSEPLLLLLEVPQGHFIRFAGPAQLQNVMASGMLIALSCIVLAMLLMGATLRRALMPLHQLSEGIQALGEGTQGVRLVARRAPPDIEQLMAHFNHMADQLEERTRILEASERGYRTLFLAARDAILLVGQEQLKVEALNPAAEQLWGQAEPHLLGEVLWLLLEPEPELEPEQVSDPGGLEPIPSALMERPPLELAQRRLDWQRRLGHPFYARVTRPDGAQRRVEVRASMLPVEGQARWMLLCQDVTESLAVWERLLRASRLSSLGMMAGGIAHQLNNPLVGVLNFAQLLARALPPQDDRQGLVQVIEESARRCQQIVRSLLDFGRAGEGETLRPLDLRRLLEELQRLSEEPVKRLSGRLELIMPSELPEILGQPVPLVQALLNLVHNGLQASGEGGVVELEARVLSPGEPACAWVVLEVRDHGPGVPLALQPRLFEPFFTTRPAGEGTGLGLALVERIVRVHGGQVCLRTRTGYGAIFELRFPVWRASAEGVT